MRNTISIWYLGIKRWLQRNLTRSGRRQAKFDKIYGELERIEVNKKNKVKISVMDMANRLVRPRKIIAFSNGKSITKTKTNEKELELKLKQANRKELKGSGLQITQELTFKDA